MKTIIKKPTKITIIQLKDACRIEVHGYNVKEEKPTNLLSVKKVKNEENLTEALDQYRAKYEVKEVVHYTKDESEIEYIPHEIFKVYKWTPEELCALLDQFLSATYGYDIETFVKYDYYDGYFHADLDVYDFDEYEEFINQFVEDFMYDHEKKNWNLRSVNWNNYFDRILREMIGTKLVFIKPVNDDIYHAGEQTWHDDKEPAYFFFG